MSLFEFTRCDNCGGGVAKENYAVVHGATWCMDCAWRLFARAALKQSLEARP